MRGRETPRRTHVRGAGVARHAIGGTTEQSGADGVRLSVVDDGPGLPREQRELASQRFWRADQHQSSRGSGLGLAIVDQLVSAAGGTLTIEAVTPHGLAVHVDLGTAT